MNPEIGKRRKEYYRARAAYERLQREYRAAFCLALDEMRRKHEAIEAEFEPKFRAAKQAVDAAAERAWGKA